MQSYSDELTPAEQWISGKKKKFLECRLILFTFGNSSFTLRKPNTTEKTERGNRKIVNPRN